MTDNLDDWLTSLVSATPSSPAIASSSPTVSSPPEESAPQPLSQQDYDDILEDYGFSQTEDIEAEEITEEEEMEEEEEDFNGMMLDENGELVDSADDDQEEYQENIDEGRDLDAEEDADWEEAIESRRVVPVDTVHFHTPDGQVDVSIVREESTSSPAESNNETLLPQNSPTLLLDESTTRFSGAEWYNEIQKKSIIVAGIGGIGSNLSFQLSRMHPASLVMYDDDMVEVVNMAGQLYARNDVGKSKVAAMSDMITSYTNMQNVYAVKDKFDEDKEAGDIMMCGFDNMEARKIFYTAWRNHIRTLSPEEQKNCLFLDGRLSIDTLQVFCLTGDDGENQVRYEDNFLFSDEEAEHTVCSMKQTTYLACMIGSIMTNLFTNWCANLLEPIIPYDLPFFTEYDAQNMIFKTIK